MAHRNLVGVFRDCAKCGDATEIVSVLQRYCKPCRLDVTRVAVRGANRRRRERERRSRPAVFIKCSVCEAAVVRVSGMQRFCETCRREHYARDARARTRRWRAEHPAHKIEARRYARERRKRSPTYAVAARMSASIYEALRLVKAGRSWETLVGYSLADLSRHLERQFDGRMQWNNYGSWHIDHIRPISSFHFASAEDQEFRDCWALTNLRPLWAENNLAKSGKRIFLL